MTSRKCSLAAEYCSKWRLLCSRISEGKPGLQMLKLRWAAKISAKHLFALTNIIRFWSDLIQVIISVTPQYFTLQMKRQSTWMPVKDYQKLCAVFNTEKKLFSPAQVASTKISSKEAIIYQETDFFLSTEGHLLTSQVSWFLPHTKNVTRKTIILVLETVAILMEMSFNLWFFPIALKCWTILVKIRGLLVVEDGGRDNTPASPFALNFSRTFLRSRNEMPLAALFSAICCLI